MISINLVFDGFDTLQATNTAAVGSKTDLLTIRGSVASCPADSKSDFNFNLLREDLGSSGNCDLARVFPFAVSAQTLIIGSPMTINFNDWTVGASNGADCTFTYTFSTLWGPPMNFSFPSSGDINPVVLSQDAVQDDGTTFDIKIDGELFVTNLISLGTTPYIFPVTIKSPC